MKIINDAIHGQFKLEGATEELLATPGINKLSHIKQLGLAHLVFPGAHHTRFEHSMGASHIAGMMAESVGLNKQDKSTLEVAAMLHDVGHGPYSHTLEHILSERGGMDHMSVTEGIILGDFDVLIEGEGDSIDERDSIPDILERNDLDPEEVASLIRGPDFLLRDSHFTGVKHGVVDLHPLVGSLGSQGGDVVVDQGGLSALEGMLLARGLMYSAVYFHRVTRVTEVMLSRAVERAGGSLPDSVDLQRRVDSEIWGALSDAGGFAKDMVTRLKYRKLLKICLSRRMEDLSEDQKQLLVSLSNDSESRRALEEELALRSGLEPGYVAIDVPSVKLLLSEPRMSQVDVRVAGDDGKTRWLREITPMADALKNRHVSQEAVYVMTLPGSESKVAEVAERHLFS